MKTIKTTITNNVQLTAFLVAGIILTVTFASMVINYGFKAW